jgi:hypothetical protein
VDFLGNKFFQIGKFGLESMQTMREKKDNSTVKAAIIGGVVTIVATVLAAIAAPLILERMKPVPTLAPTDILLALPIVGTSTDTPLVPTNTIQATQTEQILAITPTQLASLEQFIRAYYQAINDRNYEFTWSLLSDKFKASAHGSEKGGYQGYVDFWNTLDRVEVLEINILEQSNQSAKVFVAANYHHKNGVTATSERNLHFIYDLIRNTWLFDI